MKTLDGSRRLVHHLHIALRRAQVVMAEQVLDDRHGHAEIEQARGEEPALRSPRPNPLTGQVEREAKSKGVPQAVDCQPMRAV